MPMTGFRKAARGLVAEAALRARLLLYSRAAPVRFCVMVWARVVRAGCMRLRLEWSSRLPRSSRLTPRSACEVRAPLDGCGEVARDVWLWLLERVAPPRPRAVGAWRFVGLRSFMGPSPRVSVTGAYGPHCRMGHPGARG